MNEIHDWAKSSTLEVIFAQKNKLYGAYDLRMHYRNHALFALLITAVLFLCGFAALYSNQSTKKESKKIVIIDGSWKPPISKKIILPSPDVEKPSLPKDKVVPQKTIAFKQLQVVADEKVVEEMPDVDKLKSAVSGLENIVGADFSPTVQVTPDVVMPKIPDIIQENPPIEVPIKSIDDPKAPPFVEEPAYFEVVEEMPQPIGGLGVLQSQIVYPEMAKRAGIQGRVVVQFLVDEMGNVSNPAILIGIGGGCDEEALRVVDMAKFSPGMQRGKPVKVKMSIPIRFRLQ